MPKLHVHIGHHFFGSGNLGDDLMLAGFLAAARPTWLAGARLTCCTPYDADCQRLRFPEIEWLPYDDRTRAACIRRCDVWLGLGDTPFQATGGNTWFLDHLCQEAAWCRQVGVPMFYLGVGINERAVVAYPQMRLLIGQAERLWMRDDDSVAFLRDLTTPGQATAHADLAHAALAATTFPPPAPQTLGLVLNFEDPAQFRLDQLAALVGSAERDWHVRWLAQEIRPLPGSETFLHGRLPPGMRAAAPLWVPDYAGAATSRALLTAWEGLDALFTSRYHATLIGAWMGARVTVFARSDKVAGAVRQLGVSGVDGMNDPAAILRAVAGASLVERALLLDLAVRSRDACEDFFASARTRRTRPRPAATAGPGGNAAFAVREFSPMSPHLPTRVLFLRPDAYGDLFLFEPVPRVVRDAWPQAEVAVLIRQPYADAVPLFASGGVRWLTTTCNPYRQAPGDDPAALADLRETVRAFAPDCVVAACAEQTWLEAAVASFLPDARQVSLGPGLTDPLARAALDETLPVDWTAIYPEKIPLPAEETSEWKKNLGLAGALLGHEAPRWWPTAHVPADAAGHAAQIITDAGLTAGIFVVCAAAGTANVRIKSWPAANYGETLAFLEREHGVRALLIGHVSERPHLESVREAARAAGADPALWTGQDGEMPVVAGLLAAARFYFGNDTGTLHLAAALGRPVASVFGGGHWPRFAPVARRSLTVVQPLPCFGCAWDCYYADAPCVRTISVASVNEALTQFLADETDRQAVCEARGLDAAARSLIDAATPRLHFQREDSAARLRQTRELTALLKTSEADRASRLRELRASEAESLARLRQVEELTAQFKASEAERTARLEQTTKLTALLKTSETDRDARQTQVAELTALLKTSEADRDARQTQVAELTALLKTSEADRDARQTQVAELTALLKTSEADRAARAGQIEQLTAWLRAKTADCEAQAAHNQQLTARLKSNEANSEVPGISERTRTDTLDEPDAPLTSELTATPASGTPLPVLRGGGSGHDAPARFS